MVFYANPVTNKEGGIIRGAIDYEALQPALLIEADRILSDIDTAFLAHDQVLRTAMTNKTLTIDPWLITGIIEGDGYTSTNLVVRKDIRRVEARIRVGVSVLKNSSIMLELVRYFFSHSPYSLKSSFSSRAVVLTETTTKKGRKMSHLRYQSVYFFADVFVPFFKDYPLQTIKYTRINTCYNTLKNFESGSLRDVENVIRLAKNIYQTYTSHGAEKRRIPLPLLIDQIYSLYGAVETPSRIFPSSQPLPLQETLDEEVKFEDLDALEGLFDENDEL